MSPREFDQPAKVVIVDDESHAVKGLQSLLSDDKRLLVIGGISDPEEALSFIIDKKPDLLFLDIQMPVMNGFDLLKALKEKNCLPTIIFITAYDRYAVEAIKHAAFDYLLKPIEKKELKLSLDRYFAMEEKAEIKTRYVNLLEAVSPNRKIMFNSAGGFLMMDQSEILYAQADWNYAKVYRSANDAETVTMNLGAIESVLPGTRFVRINRSVIINMSYLYKVKRIARQCILKKDGIEYSFNIPLARIRHLEKLV
jgi:two-component system, LytTR family, response regulator